MEHSASELMLVGREGNLAKSGKAPKLDNSTDYDRWLHIQAGKLNWGSLLLSTIAVSSIKLRGKCEPTQQQVADAQLYAAWVLQYYMTSKTQGGLGESIANIDAEDINQLFFRV